MSIKDVRAFFLLLSSDCRLYTVLRIMRPGDSDNGALQRRPCHDYNSFEDNKKGVTWVAMTPFLDGHKKLPLGTVKVSMEVLTSTVWHRVTAQCMGNAIATTVAR